MKKNSSIDIKISKTLSWLLRHGAIKESLPISNDGYIDVDIILSHKSLQKFHCNFEVIKRIVENDLKQRYTLIEYLENNNKKLKIKANQGHSIHEINNLNLKKIENPKEISNIIHGTYLRYLKNIQKEGLKCMNRNHIHFTSNENFHENLSGFRNNCEILIYIDIEKAINDGIEFFLSENNVILSSGINNCIKPEYFLKIIYRKTKKIIK